jgi:predicted HTH transcriptional regulator
VSGRVATPTVKLKPFGRTEVAAQIAKMVARNPNISAGQVASRLDISDRTARRYLSDLRPADVRDRADTDDDPDPHHRINGNHPDLATTH